MIELVELRTSNVVRGPTLELGAAAGISRVTGPRLIELAGATCWIPEGWAGSTGAHGTLRLERHR